MRPVGALSMRLPLALLPFSLSFPSALPFPFPLPLLPFSAPSFSISSRRPMSTSSSHVPPMSVIRAVRTRSGCPLGEVRVAVEALYSGAGGAPTGSFEDVVSAAIEELRKRGVGLKKLSGRRSAEGVICVVVDSHGGSGALVEVNCETDFAAKNPTFLAFANEAAKLFMSSQQDFSSFSSSPSLASHASPALAALRENIHVSRAHRVGGSPLPGTSCITNLYVHNAVDASCVAGSPVCFGKLGALVEVEVTPPLVDSSHVSRVARLARLLAQQVVAAAPKEISAVHFDEAVLARERSLQMAELATKAGASGKKMDEKTLKRVLEGKMAKFFEEHALLQQKNLIVDVESHVEPDTQTAWKVEQMLQRVQQELGCQQLRVKAFKRFAVGETQTAVVPPLAFADEVKAKLHDSA